jgi:transitional endoplasmic reticulum ATPase
MSIDDAVVWLNRKKADEETEVVFTSEIKGYFPLDAAVAFSKALAAIYDWVDGVPVPGMFGDMPPTMLHIQTGIDANGKEMFVDVPWGRFKIPGVTGFLQLSMSWGQEPCLVVQGKTKRKYIPSFDRIADKTKEMLFTDSIYRGKSVTIDWEWKRQGMDFDPMAHAPKYLDLSKAHEENLIFSASVAQSLQLGLFTPIEHSEACRAAQVPLKRGVLLEGPYGTGKTLTALVTASKANRNGWTFIYLKSIYDLEEGLKFASMYEPAVIFVEDVDKALGGRSVESNGILNQLDGINTKHDEVITVFSTNFVEKLDKAFLRPGRLDTVVSVRPPDAEAASRLVKQYSRGLLAFDADFDAIGRTLAGQIPAVIREVVERAKIAAIDRLQGESINGEITEEDIMASMAMMEQHLKLCNAVAVVKAPDTILHIHAQAIRQGAEQIVGAEVVGHERVTEINNMLAKTA